MVSPYELLVGLALLREHKRQTEQAENVTLQAWSALMVRIGSQRCLIRRDDVDEILSLEGITPVRGVAPWLSGLSYFRGQLLNIIDLKKLYRFDASTYSPNSRILVSKGKSEWFGLRIDELIGIRHIWPDTVRLEQIPDELRLFDGSEQQCLVIEDTPTVVIDITQLLDQLSDGRSELNTQWQTKS